LMRRDRGRRGGTIREIDDGRDVGDLLHLRHAHAGVEQGLFGRARGGRRGAGQSPCKGQACRLARLQIGAGQIALDRTDALLGHPLNAQHRSHRRVAIATGVLLADDQLDEVSQGEVEMYLQPELGVHVDHGARQPRQGGEVAYGRERHADLGLGIRFQLAVGSGREQTRFPGDVLQGVVGHTPTLPWRRPGGFDSLSPRRSPPGLAPTRRSSARRPRC
jgi:hypothetical protein